LKVLLHILPSVPPEFNGLGDYCYSLWKHWPEPEPTWRIATARLPDGAREAWPEVQIDVFELTETGLHSRLVETGTRTVVLHYVGYGYARRGAPTWLPRAIKRWKKETGGKVVVMFHELYATGPPWKSEFWFCIPQWRVARDLVQIADRWITSCPRYMRVLEHRLGADPSQGQMISVASNIEPVHQPNFENSRPLDLNEGVRIAVFGMPLTRLRGIRAHRSLLHKLVEVGRIESILLIGKGDGTDPAQKEADELLNLIGLTSTAKYIYSRPTREISEALLTCQLGLVSNQPDILFKSTVFAAYASHGLLSLVPGSQESSGSAYLVNDDLKPEATVAQLATAFSKLSESAGQFSAASVAAKFAEVVNSV